MGEINACIGSLLYDHDCVVIPDFGGFVANLKGATLVPHQNAILPPRKVITFNQHLKQNDGLLIHLIGEELGLAYDDALELVKKEVLQLHEQLLAGERLEFPKVGVIYRNKDQAIQFVPQSDVNFLKSSFGLPGLTIRKIAEESPVAASTTVEPVVIPIAEAPQTEEIEEKPKKKRSIWWAAAGMAVVAVGLLAATQDYGKLTQMGLPNPFSKGPEDAVASEYQPRFAEEDIKLTHPEVENAVDFLEREFPEMGSVYYSFHENKVSPEGILIHMDESRKSATPKVVEPEKTELKTSGTSKLQMHSIIAGAFGEERNADKLVKQLRKQGFDASRVGKKGRLHLVAYGTYSNRASADMALEEIRANTNKHAWIK